MVEILRFCRAVLMFSERDGSDRVIVSWGFRGEVER